ncbi:MAG: choice-of-anchor Q domain-containing protein, partial [Anaerolineae bacterium]
GVTSTHELSGTPAFVDPAHGDYHLMSTSDALDVGIDAGIYTDLDGGVRPGGSGYDVGADEWGLRFLLPFIARHSVP